MKSMKSNDHCHGGRRGPFKFRLNRRVRMVKTALSEEKEQRYR
jgi:hypothetical protein